MQNYSVELFLHQLLLFKDYVVGFPSSVILSTQSLENELFQSCCRKITIIDDLPIFITIEEKVRTFDENPTEEVYGEIVILITKMFNSIYIHYASMEENHEFFINNTFKELYDQKLRRHKHLFRHFLLGLRVIVPVEYSSKKVH